MKRAYLPIVLFGFAIFASACGGGGGGSSALPHAGGSNVQQSTGAVVRVVMPKSGSGSSARRPNFIAPNTATIAIGIYTVNGATPSPLPSPISITIATSPDCTTSSGSTSCTITVTVPVAKSVVLQLSTYDASGNLLGHALIGPINTTLATIPTQSVSVGGVPAKIVLSPAGLSAGDDGSTHTVTFGVYAEDADNNIIIAPGTYPNPIALTITGDTNGALSLSTTSVASPGPNNGATAVTLTYNSAKATTQATLTAASGSATASIPFAPIVFTPTMAALYLSGSPQSVTVSEAGYAGAFTIPGASSTTATVTCVPANCTPSSAGGTVTINIAPGTTAGSETVSVVDANGGFANIPVTVTTTTGGGALVSAAQIHEFATTSAGANYGIAVGPDGQTLWFLDRANSALGSVTNPASCSTSCGTITEQTSPFVIASGPPIPTGLQSITAASDGNLYIADVGNTSSSDSGGELWQVNCPSAASCNAGNSISLCCSSTPQPDAVLAAPDGNLYVALINPGWTGDGEMDRTQIAGCCTSGMSALNISGVSLGTAVRAMTVDASGQNLWFTDSGTNNIGVFPIPCINCTVTEMPSGGAVVNSPAARHRPLPSAHPNIAPPRKRNAPSSGFTGPLMGIVSGPDGNLYVADQGAHTIDQISPSTCVGTSCPYNPITLNAGALPMNLVVGADGNIWFTDTSGYIGVISMRSCATACKATEYSVGGAPWGITAGPDGDIWFTDSQRNAIGKVVLQ